MAEQVFTNPNVSQANLADFIHIHVANKNLNRDIDGNDPDIHNKLERVSKQGQYSRSLAGKYSKPSTPNPDASRRQVYGQSNIGQAAIGFEAERRQLRSSGQYESNAGKRPRYQSKGNMIRKISRQCHKSQEKSYKFTIQPDDLKVENSIMSSKQHNPHETFGPITKPTSEGTFKKKELYVDVPKYQRRKIMNRDNCLSGDTTKTNIFKSSISDSLQGWGFDQGLNVNHLGHIGRCDQQYQNYFQVTPSIEQYQSEKPSENRAATPSQQQAASQRNTLEVNAWQPVIASPTTPNTYRNDQKELFLIKKIQKPPQTPIQYTNALRIGATPRVSDLLQLSRAGGNQDLTTQLATLQQNQLPDINNSLQSKYSRVRNRNNSMASNYTDQQVSDRIVNSAAKMTKNPFQQMNIDLK